MPLPCSRRVALSDFKLHHGRQRDFVLSVASNSPLTYGIWVTCASLFTVFIVVYSSVVSEHGPKIVIWLTYWSFYVLTARFLVTAVNVWVTVSKEGLNNDRMRSTQNSRSAETGEDDSDLPLVFKAQWVLQSVSNCAGILVSALFWIILYKPGDVEPLESLSAHGINAIFIIGDLLLSKAPVRFLHFIYPALFILVYTVFSGVFWAAGGTNTKGERYIYALLDYSANPGRAVGMIVGITVVVVPLLHAVCFLLFKLRDTVRRRTKLGRKRKPGPRGSDAGSNSVIRMDDLPPDINNSYGLNDDEGQLKRRVRGVDQSESGVCDAMLDNSVCEGQVDDDGDSHGTKQRKECVDKAVIHTTDSQVSCTDSTKGLLS